MKDLLSSLKTARWDTAFHTIGNSHSTLIGLLVDWWISGAPMGTRLALEPALAFVKGRLCDAILYEGSTPKGAVEVEGQKYANKLDHLDALFAPDLVYLRPLEFAIFLGYAYTPNAFPAPPFDELVEHGKIITAKAPSKQLIIR